MDFINLLSGYRNWGMPGGRGRRHKVPWPPGTGILILKDFNRAYQKTEFLMRIFVPPRYPHGAGFLPNPSSISR
jgi:hypothetical protein